MWPGAHCARPYGVAKPFALVSSGTLEPPSPSRREGGGHCAGVAGWRVARTRVQRGPAIVQSSGFAGESGLVKAPDILLPALSMYHTT